MNDIVNAPTAEATPVEVNPPEFTPPDPNKPVLEVPPFKFEPEKWFDLVKPITTHSLNGKGIETLSKIRLRAPLGGDYLELGGSYIKTVWGRGGMFAEEDPQKFRQWFMKLSGLDGAAFTQLSVRDIKKIQDWLAQQLNDAGN